VSGHEIGPYPDFLLRPVSPERPDVGVRRIVPAPSAEPSIGGVKDGIGDERGMVSPAA